MIVFTTEVDIAGIIVRDPVTAFTNIAIGVFGIACFRRLNDHDIEYPSRNWNYFFLFIGLASLIGVIVHGFSHYTSPSVHFFLWWMMGMVQGAGVSFAQFGAWSNWFSPYKSWVAILVIVQFLVFASAMYFSGSFEAAKLHIAAGLIPIMIYYFFLAARGKQAELWVAGGILLSGLTGFIHTAKISFCRWFNFNDISHVLIVISLVVMYQGVKKGLLEREFPAQV